MRRHTDARPPRPAPGAAALVAALLALLALAVLAPTLALADESAPTATWQFAPVDPPTPPPGTPEPPVTYPVPLGQIGDISFWAPNRGLLITGGTGSSCAASSGASVPCGLYAYNGRTWHVLSTVCGGAQGRIAWAGPDEFWTISDQRPGQVVTAEAEYGRVSLCHFQNGAVVGSYAMPLNQPNSYRPMNAAACLSPDDCWFGGELGEAPNLGAFHLHWDGHAVTVVYSPEDHEVFSMALAGPGVLFESVSLKVEEEEEAIDYGDEDPNHPSLLHQIDPPGSSVDFHNVLMPDPSCAADEFCSPLPDYGADASGLPVEPDTLGPLALGSDYTPSGSNPAPPQLWAVAGPYEEAEAASSGAGVAHPIALRYSEDPLTHEHLWTQVIGSEEFGGSDPFAEGDEPQGVAPEPGVAAAWITLHTEDGQAHVARATAAGKLSEQDVLGEAQGVGHRGNAGPIACAAANDCWLATSKGWLFHYTNENPSEPQLPEDTDPNFAHVITFRPTDDGVLQLPGDEPPPDDSLANQAPPPPPPPPVASPVPQVLSSGPVILGLRSHVVHRDMLELTFKLVAEAHVQLLAKRHGHVVAKTPRETLKAGRRKLLLRLNPHRWPDKLDLQAAPLHPLPVTSAPSSGQSSTGPSSAETIGT
jgi:hypothetical protein